MLEGKVVSLSSLTNRMIHLAQTSLLSIVEEYLEKVRHHTRECYTDRVLSVALDTYQKARHDSELAFQLFVALPKPEYTLRAWSQRENALFEELLREHGKRFHHFREKVRVFCVTNMDLKGTTN